MDRTEPTTHAPRDPADRHRRRITREEDAEIRRLLALGWNDNRVAAMVDVSPLSVKTRREQGVSVRLPVRVEARIEMMLASGHSPAGIAHKTGIRLSEVFGVQARLSGKRLLPEPTLNCHALPKPRRCGRCGADVMLWPCPACAARAKAAETADEATLRRRASLDDTRPDPLAAVRAEIDRRNAEETGCLPPDVIAARTQIMRMIVAGLVTADDLEATAALARARATTHTPTAS